MGRKSSSKTQTRSATSNAGGAPPDPPKRSASPLIIVAVIVVAAIAGIVVASRSSQTQSAADTQTASTPPAAQPAADVEPPYAKFGPHKQAQLPPLPYEPMAARAPDVVRAAYLFAAEHPEILSYVPCYCGCERSGHRGNDDCFVAARDANGDVTQWEPHGAT